MEQREMPRYKSHKIVHALKIKAIELDAVRAQEESRETDGGAWITPEDAGYARFKVDYQFVKRNLNVPRSDNGYYVVYEDGYASWSPTKAFEDGYTKIK